MKYIITENQSSFLRRRLSIIDEFVEYALHNYEVFDEGYSLSEYLEEICWRVYDLLDEHGHNVDNIDDDIEGLFKFIKETYGTKIKSRYYKLQGDVVNDD